MDSDDSIELKLGCFSVFVLSTGVVVWLFSGLIGFWKALWVGLVMNLTTLLLSAMGIIPVLGQWLYKQFAGQAIQWVYGFLQVNPNTPISAPAWINTILNLFPLGIELKGSLLSYTFSTGYTLSVLVSIVVGFVIIALIVGRIQEM